MLFTFKILERNLSVITGFEFENWCDLACPTIAGTESSRKLLIVRFSQWSFFAVFVFAFTK
ncbi:MAG: hypothetical protein ACRCYY_00960 [Trueperaceae bacterium]